MSATLTYHRSRPYSEQELYLALMAYLEHNYVFRKLEIDQWLGDDRIIYKHKEEYDPADFSLGKSSEELWSDGVFEDWRVCTPMAVKNVCSEFLFRNSAKAGKNRKTLLKDVVTAEINHGSLVETIKFNPLLKQLIDKGRYKVTGVKPLLYTSNKREKIELSEGDTCYFCWNTKNPYVANPAYVFRKAGGSYIIIFFTNLSKGTETGKPEINMARFINAPADEIGLTPEQAVMQRFC
jgi:hypothetical protein